MGLTYKASGVDREAGYKEVKLIKDIVKSTNNKGVMSDIGGFSGLFNMGAYNYKNPVLVSGTDGVGTKVQLAVEAEIYSTIGEDCVAMCVNDIICQGAKPLFFLDYIGCGKLIPEKMAEIVKGVAAGCIKSGAALIGGETAEMPGTYSPDDFDLAGFCVGVVEKDSIITGENIYEGDQLIALASSGIHSNGYSLVRKIISEYCDYKLDDFVPELQSSLADELLKPTRIYAKVVNDLQGLFKLKGLSHITGGGIYENLPRILADDLGADIDLSKVKIPEIFNLLQKWGNVNRSEMYNTFNMGIGMILVVSQKDLVEIEKYLNSVDEEFYNIGRIVRMENLNDLGGNTELKSEKRCERIHIKF